MKKLFLLNVLITLALSACVQKNTITPSKSRVGYSAWNTQVSYTHCDPLPKTGKPELVRGTWEMNDGILQHKVAIKREQSGVYSRSAMPLGLSKNSAEREQARQLVKAGEHDPLAICNYVIPSDHYTIHCTARKDSGPEGFVIVFNYVDSLNYCRLKFGCEGNTHHSIEQVCGNSRRQLATRPGSVETGKWYDVNLAVAGDSVKAWLDSDLVFDEVLK